METKEFPGLGEVKINVEVTLNDQKVFGSYPEDNILIIADRTTLEMVKEKLRKSITQVENFLLSLK